jgi:hypothetical protein
LEINLKGTGVDITNSWSQLPFSKKMLIVDYWTLCILLSNMLHILGFVFLIIPMDDVYVKQQDFMIGCGTSLCWLSVTKYLQYSKDFYTLPATMLGAGRQIFMVMISATPIFMGIAYFMMSAFAGDCYRFRSLDRSLI